MSILKYFSRMQFILQQIRVIFTVIHSHISSSSSTVLIAKYAHSNVIFFIYMYLEIAFLFLFPSYHPPTCPSHIVQFIHYKLCCRVPSAVFEAIYIKLCKAHSHQQSLHRYIAYFTISQHIEPHIHSCRIMVTPTNTTN